MICSLKGADLPNEDVLDDLEAAFADEEEIQLTEAQMCSLENPESCESCQ